MNNNPPKPASTNLFNRLTTGRGILILTAISLAFIVMAIVGTYIYFSNRSVPPAELTPPISLEELAKQYPQLSRVLQDEKLDSVYKQFMIAFQDGGVDAAYELAKKRGILNSNNEVRMTLELDTTDTSDIQASLENHGIKVTAVSNNLIDIAIPADVLKASLESDSPGAVFMDISGLEHIVRIRLPIQAIHDVGSVETEGVAVIGADVWQKAGITGKGIKIGVLDVGFDGYKDLLGTDLPSNVVTKSFIGGLEIDNTGVVHGSAVSEIIHDIAPDAELYLADYQTTAEKQAAVDWLMSQNVDIISSSTGSTYGRRDDKGLLAKMVDDVVAQGVLWVNSSGNTGYSHLRGQFTDTNNDGYHEFAPGDQYLGFAPLGSATLALNWNDWDGGTQDLDLHILDSHGDEIASSTDRQSGPGSDAGEFIYYEFPDEGPYYMAIYGYKVTRPVTFDFFLRDGEIEYYTPEYSVNTPGDSMGAITVGAVNWKSGALEDYSSRGPTDDGRIKPELVAPSGVSSAAYGEAWDGTSASCPHVSGAAALIMQAYPDYTIQQVKDYLFSHALDLGKSGEDADTGYGALRLGPPPEITNNQPPPVPTKEVPTPAPTVTPPANPTITPLPTATPVLEDAPKSTGSSSNASLVPLLLLGCVVLPAILGLGGIGVLGAVFVMRRSRPKARPAPKVPQNQDVQKRPAPTASPPPIPGEEEIVCSNCGKHNRPGTRFCSACGTELSAAGRDEVARPIFCTQCGNALRPNAKFCPNCGTPVKKA